MLITKEPTVAPKFLSSCKREIGSFKQFMIIRTSFTKTRSLFSQSTFGFGLNLQALGTNYSVHSNLEILWKPTYYLVYKAFPEKVKNSKEIEIFLRSGK